MMKKDPRWWWKIEYALGIGLFLLRGLENKSGFDPDTGLSLPSTARTLILVFLAASLALEVMTAVRLPQSKRTVRDAFAVPDKEMNLLSLGCLALAAGGALLVVNTVTGTLSIPPLVAGVLGVAAGAGLYFAVKRMKDGGECPLLPVLPALFFGVFLVLAVYIPHTADPVLARYYLPVLASAFSAYGFAQLSGFMRGEGNPRTFSVTANLAIITCLAVLSDDLSFAYQLLFGGCAVTFAGFTLLMSRANRSEEDPA